MAILLSPPPPPHHPNPNTPTQQVTIQGGDGAAAGAYPALKLTFKNDTGGSSGSGSSGGEKEKGKGKETREIVAVPYRPPNPGPYPQDQPQRNAVRFTPVQVCVREGVLFEKKGGGGAGRCKWSSLVVRGGGWVDGRKDGDMCIESRQQSASL
jgi:hypothetical protein